MTRQAPELVEGTGTRDGAGGFDGLSLLRLVRSLSLSKEPVPAMVPECADLLRLLLDLRHQLHRYQHQNPRCPPNLQTTYLRFFSINTFIMFFIQKIFLFFY